MTEDISQYKFDFRKEVNALVPELGERGSLVSFAEVDVDPSRKDPAEILQIIGPALFRNDVHMSIKNRYREEPDYSSYYDAALPRFRLGEFISFIKDEGLTKIFGEKHKDLMRLFTLYHEAAHLLISENSKINNESAADAYAAIRLLQRFGNEARPLLSMWSWYRNYAAIHGGADHFSTLTLDRIIADSATGNYSALTPTQVKEYAERYSSASTPSPGMLRGTKKAFKSIRGFLQKEDFSPAAATRLLEAGLNSKSQLANYMAAKFFSPFMNPEGVDFYRQRSHYDKETINRYTALIENRADITKMPRVARRLGVKAPSRLRRIFSKKAEKSQATSLSGFMPVIVPAGQQRFTFDY